MSERVYEINNDNAKFVILGVLKARSNPYCAAQVLAEVLGVDLADLRCARATQVRQALFFLLDHGYLEAKEVQSVNVHGHPLSSLGYKLTKLGLDAFFAFSRKEKGKTQGMQKGKKF